MPQRSITIFTNNTIGSFLYRSRFIIAIASALILLLSSCKKSTTGTGGDSPTILELYFASNVLDKTFIVHQAVDAGVDVTTDYTGYSFILSKTTSYYDGPLTGRIGSNVYTGTWSSNSDYSKLVINLTSPSIPAEFIFLNRVWRFTDKAIPIISLAPWNGENKVLLMERLP